MQYKTEIIPYTLHFKRPAKTSRGQYIDHQIWYVKISDVSNPHNWGIGECAPLPDLSCDFDEDYEGNLRKFCKELEAKGTLDIKALRPYPSILFGLETALLHLNAKSFRLYNTPFSNGEQGITINGLIWMGNSDYMLEQIESKIEQGFRCIKLKIGAINFQKELSLLKHIRKHFSAGEITLRVDANGAFSPVEALEKLKRLSELDLHSIEQPIKAEKWSEMARLCEVTPLPIALDEELIGVHEADKKKELLNIISPQYIILKPTLHGGISGCAEWIELAEKQDIGWWITSALESNIGLNAIAQWCSTFDTNLPQGLGTGALYTNNIQMPLYIEKDQLWFDPNGEFFSFNDLRNVRI
ncbi:MAG TPA: o-succinylbenzoate synthase [Dysgonomonas sp.]|nr:o-succinylbenzoate synthase [Dysgonomonas sp.]